MPLLTEKVCLKTIIAFVISFFVFSEIIGQHIVINEFMASNTQTIADDDGDFEDWIEIYNPGASPVNLENFGLSDNVSNPFKWTFPQLVIGPGEYLIIWASGKDRNDPAKPLHTNFSISSDGEPLLLSAGDGALINLIPAVSLIPDVSYGRFPDSGPDWYFFMEATPGQSNTTQTFDQILSPPVFSHSSGFYHEGFTLTLSPAESGSEIFYTLDGSDPDNENITGTGYPYKNIYPQHPGDPFGEFLTGSFITHTYSEAGIEITDISGEPDSMTHKASAFYNNPWYFPDNPVYKGITVRARSYRQGSIPSPVKTEVFFVNPLGRERFTLPVINISTNPGHFYDYYDGIYNAGIDFDTWRQNNPLAASNGGRPANYRRRGIEWEFPAHFTFFDVGSPYPDLNQDIGFRIHGGWSRALPMKSLRIYARGRYGPSELGFPFFPDQPYDAYRRIILRNSGNDWPFSMFRDALIQQVVGHLNFETLAYRPSVLLVNGEYWGIHNIRERYDKHYLERVFGVDPDDIDYLEGNAVVKEGNNLHYISTLNYIQNNDITQNEHYEHILTRIDTENYIDYQIANIYAANTDWPGNNVDYWRKRTNTYVPNSPYGHDGRWRWLAFDMDFGFAFIHGTPSSNHNTLAFATEAGNTDWPNPDWSTFLLRNLLLNETFRHQFINRFADLINTAFLPVRINSVIDEFQSVIQPEMPEHIDRWKVPANMAAWNHEINRIRHFVNNRPHRQRGHILNHFNLADSTFVTLNVTNTEQGHIRINTTDITPETPGLNSDAYPWTGIYFVGVPVTLKAIANEGYEFSHWVGYDENTGIIIADPSELAMITAHFKPKESNGEEPETRELIHFWYFSTDLPNDTPLEYITSHYSVNEEGLLGFHSALSGYPFSPGSPLWRKASMERRNAPTHLNYRAEGNGQLPYNETIMRAIQVKQPFEGDGGENTLYFQIPSTGYEKLLFRFAVKDEFAAEKLIVDYSVNSEQEIWTNSGLENHEITLEHDYKLITLDFSEIQETENNPYFRIRLRFECNDPFLDEGHKVVFNNFSLEGDQLTTHVTNSYYHFSELEVFPNPVRKGETLILKDFWDIFLFDTTGRFILSKNSTNRLTTEKLDPGTYILKTSTGKIARIIILP
ncbi:MAG: T9SS C-terminal target domain-containing protein [Bacteroidetes bacterium]|nr:MAG: T9SS C-terminal target domain-containing protein [Bacteroidota bacterium]